MRIRLTEHAHAQLLARNIPDSRILEAVRHPDRTLPAPGGASRYRKRFANGILQVICVTDHGQHLILTAYYL